MVCARFRRRLMAIRKGVLDYIDCKDGMHPTEERRWRELYALLTEMIMIWLGGKHFLEIIAREEEQARTHCQNCKYFPGVLRRREWQLEKSRQQRCSGIAVVGRTEK